MTSAKNPKRISKMPKTKIIGAVQTEIGVPTTVTAGVMRSGAATPIDTRCGATVRSHGSTVPPTAKILAVLRCSHRVQLQSTNQKGKHAQTLKKQQKLGIQAAGQKRMESVQFPTEKMLILQRPLTAIKYRKEKSNCRQQQCHNSIKLQFERPWHPSPQYARK